MKHHKRINDNYFWSGKESYCKYAGKSGRCKDTDEVDLFLKEVIQQLLFRGAAGNLRKWEFCTQNGCFTAPPDLELPVKIRLDGKTGRASQVYDKWYEFYDQSTLADCVPCEDGIVEEINTFYTAFDPPCGGARILAVPRCKEDEDAHFVIQGLDREGKEVFISHQGDHIKGERLTINKEKRRYTKVAFTKITGITKTKTKNYVQLHWYCPDTGSSGLLGEYKPSDTNPSFRRFRVLGADGDCPFKITLLGRIRFCENYDDNDIIPISNLRALKLMAQQIQAEDNDSIQTASYKNQRIEQTLQNENQYKRTPQAPLDFYLPTAPGSIKNLI